jgi:predicted YcjX-like family ATPase
MSDVWNRLRDSTLSAGAAVRDMANVKTLRLAITGLSGAGKTVFLVSVISNLLATVRGTGGKKWDSLPRLREMLTNPQGQSRLLGIEIEPSGVGLIPRFPYEAFRDVLASGNGQGWPRSTE